MIWTLMTIREIGGAGDGALYPVPSEVPNGIVFDGADTRRAPTVTATALELKELMPEGRRDEVLVRAENIKASVYVTDARVAVACTKYDKGGGWIGGVGALGLNAVSKARAALRRRGKSLVGQVRYPWLASVGYTTKTGWLSSESLRMTASEQTNGVVSTYALVLTLPKTTSAEKLAREIAQRAARFRLEHTEIDTGDERAALESLLTPRALAAEKGRYSVWRFPAPYFASARSGRGDLAEGAVAWQ